MGAPWRRDVGDGSIPPPWLLEVSGAASNSEGPDDTEEFVASLCYSDLRRLSFPEEASHCSYADLASLA